MAGDLQIRCQCGTVRGVARRISRGDSNHAVCYCSDCQAYAHFIGRPADLLDANGGTDVVQISPARLELSAGRERLRCARLSDSGSYRWYAGCCRMPIGNTPPSRQMPFVGVVHACVEGGRDAIERAVGPVRTRVWGQYAQGDTSGLERLHTALPPAAMLRLGMLIAKWRALGGHKRSPFFDPATGEPVSAPHVLTDAERDRAVAAARARPGV